MSREVRRVPKGFDWPLNKIWEGYLMPDFLGEMKCPDCELGYSPRANIFYKEWYGNAPFDPLSTGSTPFYPEGEEARRWAKRQIERTPEYYGTGEIAMVREATRITELWNSMWMHHLSNEDVAALMEDDRLREFTHVWQIEESGSQGWKEPAEPWVLNAAEVNRANLFGMGHDSLNQSICIAARCEREGVEVYCATCEGSSTLEAYDGQRALMEAWEATEPPTGESWQLWETVSEGSPVTPVFDTAEELAEHISNKPRLLGPSSAPITVEAALNWIQNSGWAPSMAFSNNQQDKL